MMRKLEIGAGRNKIDSDWEVLDAVKSPIVDIVTDVCKPLPIMDDTYDLIYMSHVLEHVPWYETVKVLRELHRILKKGGVVEIWVPDFVKIIKIYTTKKIPDGWYRLNPDKSFMTWINGRLFAGHGGGFNWHRATFDSNYLHKCLNVAGFSELTLLKKPRAYNHGYINLGMSGRK